MIDDAVRDEIKFNVNSFVKNANSICGNSVNKKFHQTLKGLKANKSIKILNMDKGNGVVIMDAKDYYNKLGKIVLDKSKFMEIEVPKDDTHPVIKKQNSVTYYLDKYVKSAVDESIFDSLTPIGAQPGKIQRRSSPQTSCFND